MGLPASICQSSWATNRLGDGDDDGDDDDDDDDDGEQAMLRLIASAYRPAGVGVAWILRPVGTRS